MGEHAVHFYLAAVLLCVYSALTALNSGTTADENVKRADQTYNVATTPRTVQALENLVQQQSAYIQQQSEAARQQAEEIRALKARLTAVENQAKATDTKVTKLQTQNVAFTAYFNEGGAINFGESSPIPFSHTTTNVGNCYDRGNGVFTAPVSGTYLFLVHVTGDGSTNAYVRIAIQKSGSDVMYVDFQGDNYPRSQGSNFVTTHVRAGEKVLVKHAWGATSMDKWFGTTFTGLLLFADSD